MDLFSKMPQGVQSNSSDIRSNYLTSTAWNALIHRPADVSDSEELPSTVDMDAIKGAPSTPLAGQVMHWGINDKCNKNEPATVTDSSSDDNEGDDDDSDSNSHSSTDSDGSGSNSCSWTSNSSSSSRSSSCSSGSRSQSLTSSPARQTFSIRETNFEQGGLKLKLAALKVSKNSKCASRSQTGTESDSCSSQSQEKLRDTRLRRCGPANVQNKVTFSDDTNKNKKTTFNTTTKTNIVNKTSPLVLRGEKKNKAVNNTTTCVAVKPLEKPKTENKTNTSSVVKGSPVKKETKQVQSSNNKKKTETSKLRSVRHKPGLLQSAPTNNKSVISGNGNSGGGTNQRYTRTTATTANNRSRSTGSDSSDTDDDDDDDEDDDDDDDDDRPDDDAHITELAQQLGHIGGASENLPNMSEHLQVINQEDLAAILPDVTSGNHDNFDGFEDVSSESGKQAKKDGGAQDSSSDVELPEQIVSDAIKRIVIDSEDVDNSENERTGRGDKNSPQKVVHNQFTSSASSSGDEGEHFQSSNVGVYSSELLEQFVEKTELLTAQCEKLLKSGGRRKRGRPPKTAPNAPISVTTAASSSAGAGVNKAMPELEAYRLDCSHSNVSPDSGIQSVPGSPMNEHVHRDATPPVLRPVSPVKQQHEQHSQAQVRKKPGRPKKTDVKSAENSRPPIHSLIPTKRGPGRPKKAPPVLEPNLPLKKHEDKLNNVLNEVSRRLEIPRSKNQVTTDDIERLLNTRNNRNRKLDTLFNKSIKLTSVPNIAIVKPMQHHLLMEKLENDEKNKRCSRRTKSTHEDEDKDLDNKKQQDKIDKDNGDKWKKKRKEHDKNNSPNNKRQNMPEKTSHKNKNKKLTQNNKIKINALPVINKNKMTPKKVPKYVSIRHGLSKHKHKKRKKNKKEKNKKKHCKKSGDREWFMKELEKLVVDFQKCTIAVYKKTPALTAIVAPVPSTSEADSNQQQQQQTQPNNNMVVPAEFKVKRIGKKRKGSERSRGSDRESQPDKSKQSDRESGTEQLEGEQVSKEKEKPKRKHKKNHVEVVKQGKDRAEANTNEQRLPLKKRHYHLTSTAAASSSQQQQQQTQPTSGNSDATHVTKSPSHKSNTIFSPANPVTATSSTDKQVNKEPTSGHPRREGTERTSQRVSRNSIDEAIEATITRFMNDSVVSDTNSDSSCNQSEVSSSNQRSVIVTPKKRHRVEDLETSNKTQLVVEVKNNPQTPVSKQSPASHRNVQTTATTPATKTTNKQPSQTQQQPPAGSVTTKETNNREGVIKVTGVVDPRRRSGSRSSSKDTKPAPTLQVETKRNDVKPVEEKVKKVERMTRSCKKNDPTRTSARLETKAAAKSATNTEEHNTRSSSVKHDEMPVLTVETEFKIEPATDVVEGKSRQPVAGIFEPSTKAVDIDSSILAPLTSPSGILSIKGSLSLKKLRAAKALKGLGIVVSSQSESEATEGESLDRKKKSMRNVKDVRVNIQKLTQSELLKRAVEEVKKKVRRRKTINRTGFPIKKKKKKLVNIINSNSVIKIETKQSTTRSAAAAAALATVTTTKKVKEQDTVDTMSDSSNSNLPLSDLKKTNEKISTRIAEKLNAGRIKRSKNVKNEVETKKIKICVEKIKTEVVDKMVVLATPAVVATPATNDISSSRKRKRANTIRSTSSKFKKRATTLPMLSMKKFKRCVEDESRAPSEDRSSEVSHATDISKSKKAAIPRWRKKYLTAGLLSDYYKEHNQTKPNTKQNDKMNSKLIYNREEHEHGLLPPPAYCNKFVRLRRMDFQLPYDLWWLHTNSQLPGRDIVPSWNYRKIRTNVYYDVKPQINGRYEAQACNCVPPSSLKQKGCGEDCINRMVYAECSPQLCPCKERCSNQKIQKHDFAPGLDKFMTKDKGWGVKTRHPIKPGQFILEYVGEVVSEKEFKDRMATRYTHDTHHYCLHLDGGLVIDGHRMGGDGRFVNHSCDPNCEMQKWSVNGLFRMALFSLRPIPAHQELTYDYNFSLFNPAEGQQCRCGSKDCRGVIGGKSQRVTIPSNTSSLISTSNIIEKKQNGRLRKNGKAKKHNDKDKNKMEGTAVKASSKPMSHQQRCFAQIHHCFLLRNIEKVKQSRDSGKPSNVTPSYQDAINNKQPVEVKHSDVFYTQLNALSTLRSIKTRRLAQAEDNPEMAKFAKLAYVFRDLYNVVVTAKDERGEPLSAPFTSLPAKRKLPSYYQRVTEPIDLNMIEQNINSGLYTTVMSFDQDFNKLFTNNVRFYGRTTELGIAATRLRRAYNVAKLNVIGQLEEILGEAVPASFIPEKTDPGGEEDVIRCICGLYRDEGVMIQCERCLVWQHCDCVKADDSIEHYLCEKCEPRNVNLQIIMDPQPEYATEGTTHYISLLRGDLQMRQGDTVYVLRDMIEEDAPKTSPPTKVTYKTIKNVNYADLDIFRIERLWIDDKGDKFAFGHHYLRPHETYHEPTRKFFHNEVMRVPLYEIVPFDLIMCHCWVLDLNTFCKGRPVGAPEEHIYICEYRVDKSAHLFAKIAKPYPICTKSYAFDRFDQRIKPARTYTPHGEVPIRSRARSTTRSVHEDEHHSKSEVNTCSTSSTTSGVANKESDEEELPLARVRDHVHAAKREIQKKRLNGILLKLLNRLPSKQPLDLSYLLEPVKRYRNNKKTVH